MDIACYKACCIFSHTLSDSVISITPQRRLIKETTQYTGCYCPSAYFGTDSGWRNDTITVNGSSGDNSMNYLIMGPLNSSTVLRGEEPTKCNNIWNYTINGIQIRTSAPTTSQKAVNGGDMAFDTKNKNLYIANSNSPGDWTLLNGRDYTPIEGSDNYVTSGALYDIFKVINERISALEA